MKSMRVNEWLVWSNEHKAWWGPNSLGYTKSRKSAGYYSFKQALKICSGANAYLPDDAQPNETMMYERR
jgi:hypothetical protein